MTVGLTDQLAGSHRYSLVEIERPRELRDAHQLVLWRFLLKGLDAIKFVLKSDDLPENLSKATASLGITLTYG